jgi:hypothetical protein
MNYNLNTGYGQMTRSIPMTAGKIFWVAQSGTPEWDRLSQNLPYDPDGTKRIFTTIQGAVDAVTSADGTYCGAIIYVAPGKYAEEVKIVSKPGLRIIGLTGWAGGTDYGAPRIRASDASTHYPFTSVNGNAVNGACFHVLSRDVEITGFYLDGGGTYCGVYMGGGLYGGITGYTNENASGCWVHHNMIRGGAEGKIGISMDGPRFAPIIEDNVFERWASAAIDMGPGNANIECAVIRRNHIFAANAAYGVQIYGSADIRRCCIGPGNVFSDGSSLALTAGILSNAGASGVTSVVGNYFACATPLNLLATDVHCGNYKGTFNTAEVYVSEA